MADLTTKIVALSAVENNDGRELYDFLLVDGEEILLSYKSIRDRLILTNKRFIVVDVQGLTGRKKEYMSIAYSKLSAFSCESAGSFDIDAELKIWASGIGKVEFEFTKNTDVRPIAKLISNLTL